MVTPHDLGDWLEHFRARVLQDALSEATASYWSRRAEQFQEAAPRLGDFHGKRTREELGIKWREMHTIASACHNAASMAPLQDYSAEVEQGLREAS